MADLRNNDTWTLNALHSWETLIDKAAAGVVDGLGPNASSFDDILIARIDAIQTAAELNELAHAMAAAVRVLFTDAGLTANSSMMRTIADVALHAFPRFRESLVSLPSIAQLAERLQGSLNADASTPARTPFSEEGKSRLYARLVLRELGSPLTSKEVNEDFLLVGADPAILLDGLLADGNFDLFASAAMFYFYQGWLEPTDVFLRFDSWMVFIQSSGKPRLRKRLAAVDSDEAGETNGRRAALRYLRSFSELAASNTARLTADELVFDGHELAMLFNQAIDDHFGGEDYQNVALGTSSLAHMIDAKTATLQISCANFAQGLLTAWFPDRIPKSDLVDIVCRTAGTTRPPNSRVEMNGVTSAQVVSLMRAS